MQFKEWIVRNGVQPSALAKDWGMSPSTLSRYLYGQLIATIEIITKAFELSHGEVTHLDWIETGRARLEALGKIQPGEKFSPADPRKWPAYHGVFDDGSTETKRGRGRPKGSKNITSSEQREPGSGRKKGPRPPERQQEQSVS